MSWIQSCLAPFMRGLVKGFMQEYSRPAGQSYSAGSYDFRQYTQTLSQPTGTGGTLGYDSRRNIAVFVQSAGFRMASLSERSAAFDIPFQGCFYTGTAAVSGNEAVLSVYSNVRFPPGRIPAELAHQAMEIKKQLRQSDLDLDVAHADNHSAFCVDGYIAASELTQNVFRGAFLHLAEGMSKFDEWLARQGYGC